MLMFNVLEVLTLNSQDKHDFKCGYEGYIFIISLSFSVGICVHGFLRAHAALANL